MTTQRQRRIQCFKELYLDWLSETIDYGKGPRARVRYPKQYEQFSILYLDNSIMDDRNIWVSSDLHFGHKNIIKYADRPFEDKDIMDKELIKRHNSVVHHKDHILFLGDLAFKSAQQANQLLGQMAGLKTLVVGNHDLQKKKLKKYNIDDSHVHLLAILERDDYIILFTHFPIENLPDCGYCHDGVVFNVHGHTHNQEESSIKHINVSVEHTDYTPINMFEIERLVKSRLLEIQG